MITQMQPERTSTHLLRHRQQPLVVDTTEDGELVEGQVREDEDEHVVQKVGRVDLSERQAK